MATQDRTGGTVISGVPWDGRASNKMYLLDSGLISLATKASVASDTFQCLDITAGTYVTQVFVIVSVAEDSTLTATVGDGAGASDWDASVNLENTGTTLGVGGTDTYATNNGKLYSTADTIDLVFSANAGDTAVFRVLALCVDVT